MINQLSLSINSEYVVILCKGSFSPRLLRLKMNELGLCLQKCFLYTSTTKSSLLLTILSIPHNPKYIRQLINIKPAGSTRSSNHLTLIAHPPPLLLKHLIVHTTEPLLSSGIVYPNLWELSITRHLILQSLVNVLLYHSHFLRPNFAHISKHTFSASRIHLNLLSCSDWPHRSLP